MTPHETPKLHSPWAPLFLAEDSQRFRNLHNFPRDMRRFMRNHSMRFPAVPRIRVGKIVG